MRHHEHDESRPQDPKSTFAWKCVEMFKSRVVVVVWKVREKESSSTNRSGQENTKIGSENIGYH